MATVLIRARALLRSRPRSRSLDRPLSIAIDNHASRKVACPFQVARAPDTDPDSAPWHARVDGLGKGGHAEGHRTAGQQERLCRCGI